MIMILLLFIILFPIFFYFHKFERRKKKKKKIREKEKKKVETEKEELKLNVVEINEENNEKINLNEINLNEINLDSTSKLNSIMGFNSLPCEILTQIFSYSSFESLLNISQLNRICYIASSENIIWRKHFIDHFKQDYLFKPNDEEYCFNVELQEERNYINWKDLYHHHLLLRYRLKEGDFVQLSYEGHKAAVYCLDYLIDRNLLITGSGDGFLKIWENSNNCLNTMEVHQGSVTCLKLVKIDKETKSFVLDKLLWLESLNAVIRKKKEKVKNIIKIKLKNI